MKIKIMYTLWAIALFSLTSFHSLVALTIVNNGEPEITVRLRAGEGDNVDTILPDTRLTSGVFFTPAGAGETRHIDGAGRVQISIIAPVFADHRSTVIEKIVWPLSNRPIRSATMR